MMCVLVCVILVSCTQTDSDFFNKKSEVSLMLQLGQLSRATSMGVDTLNENKIETIDVFLFSSDANNEAAAVKYVRFGGSGAAFDVNNGEASLNFDVTLDEYHGLFPSEDKNCKAYVIVNRPDGCELPATCSLSNLKRLVISSSDFQTTRTEGGKKMTTKQSNFVMDGFADNITRGDGIHLTGNIPLKRAAVKISFVLNEIADEIVENGITWQPDLTSVQIKFRNGCNRAYLNETPSNYLTLNKTQDLYVLESLDLNAMLDNNTGSAITTRYPIYTYPTYWGKDDECYTSIVLVVTWKDKQGYQESRPTYYQIPINVAGDFLMRNSYYKLLQKVNILGSDDEDEPTKIYPSSYVVLDWGKSMTDTAGSQTQTDAAISKLRYLVVDEPFVELNNITSRNISYSSSEPIKIANLVISKSNTNANVSVREELVKVDNLVLVDNSCTISNSKLKKDLTLGLHTSDNGSNYVFLNHELVNEMNADSDYSEYVFDFDLVLDVDDGGSYVEHVQVIQYPMIGIKADLNSDYNDDDNDDNDTVHAGYVRINNKKTSGSWDSVRGLVGTNKNPNRYIISVASLSEEALNDYIMGDPRSKQITTYEDDTAVKKDSDGEILNNYFKTRNDSESEKMISPQFMVASSYGVCSDATELDLAEKRCATYQEDGYPAGRWRVPTKAEVKYIIQLSGWKVIPVLFNNNNGSTKSYYWSAHGIVQNVNGTVSNVTTRTTAYVRCVYDTWYWGTEQLSDRTKFVYGDKER